MSLLEKLQELLKDRNTKSYSKLVSGNSEISQYVTAAQSELVTGNVSETLWCLLNATSPPVCPCGNAKRIFNTFNLGYRKFCSNSCPSKSLAQSEIIAQQWQQSPEKKASMIANRNVTNLEKYGNINAACNTLVQDKIAATNLERYGAATPFASALIQSKIKETMQSQYGVDSALQSPEIRAKAAATFKKNHPDAADSMSIARHAYLATHGVNPFATDAVKEKLRSTRMERYGYLHALQRDMDPATIAILESRDDFISVVSGLTIAEAGEKLGICPTTVSRRATSYDCRSVFSQANRSRLEFKIECYLTSIGLIENQDYFKGDRIILSGLELDFYFPSIKSAIEVGSVFWHSELSSGRAQSYHYNKWKKCDDAGISLYQYWDFEIDSKWAVIKSKIDYMFNRHACVVGARLVKDFRLLSVSDERDFLTANHLQGFSGDRTQTMGAYVNGELVALMAIANRPHGVEIVRYATDLAASYPGLFSKLLKRSLSETNIIATTVWSFSDNRHGSGNVYANSGFILHRDSAPTYYYTRDYHSIEHKKKFNKAKIHNKFGVDIEGKTEWQLMQELGYDRIWDAGKRLWKLDYHSV